MNEPSAGQRTRLLLIDDHSLFREGLSRLLAAEPDLEIVGECTDFVEALQRVAEQKPDVILMELRVRGERCDAFISAARRAGCEGKFLLVAGRIDFGQSAAALRLGASGVFLKSDSSSRLLSAVRHVASGEAWVDQKVIELIARRYPSYEDPSVGLTAREQVILKGLLEGLTNRKIGEKLSMSESAVKGTLQHLFKKSGVHTRSQLVRAALEGRLGLAERQSSK